MKAPVLSFDVTQITERFQFLNDLHKKYGIAFLFPVKSFNQPLVIGLATNFLQGLEVAELTEANGLPASKTIWINRNFPELNSAGANIYRTIDHLSNDLAVTDENLILRLNSQEFVDDPGFRSRFGLLKAEAMALIKSSSNIRGLHLHHGSNKNTLGTFQEIQRQMKVFLKDCHFDPEVLNWGGGFSWLSFDDIETLVKEAKAEFPLQQHFFEPGRWLSESSGRIEGQVLDVSVKGSSVKIWTNISKILHLHWSFPKLMLPPGDLGEGKTSLQVQGPTQSESDIVGSFEVQGWNAQDLAEYFTQNQKIVLKNICGYSYGWNRSFNGVPAADIEWLNTTEAQHDFAPEAQL